MGSRCYAEVLKVLSPFAFGPLRADGCPACLSGQSPNAHALCLHVKPSSQVIYWLLSNPKYRSHFGSRYKLGCCGHAGLFLCSLRSYQQGVARPRILLDAPGFPLFGLRCRLLGSPASSSTRFPGSPGRRPRPKIHPPPPAPPSPGKCSSSLLPAWFFPVLVLRSGAPLHGGPRTPV